MVVTPDPNRHFYHGPAGPFIFWCHTGSPSDLERHLIFKPASKAEKHRKLTPGAPKKLQKSTLESPMNVFVWKHGFCNTFHAKTLF